MKARENGSRAATAKATAICGERWYRLPGRRLIPKGTFLSALFFRFSRRMGMEKASVAPARRLLTILFRIPKHGESYWEFCGDYFDRLNPERAARRFMERPDKLGCDVSSPPVHSSVDPVSHLAAARQTLQMRRARHCLSAQSARGQNTKPPQQTTAQPSMSSSWTDTIAWNGPNGGVDAYVNSSLTPISGISYRCGSTTSGFDGNYWPLNASLWQVTSIQMSPAVPGGNQTTFAFGYTPASETRTGEKCIRCQNAQKAVGAGSSIGGFSFVQFKDFLDTSELK
jgi:hypothetical protein